MRVRNFPMRRLAALIPLAFMAAGLRAELIRISPFLPPQSAAAPEAATNAPIEFRGYWRMGDVAEYRVVLADPNKKVGSWLKIGERDANLGVVVKGFDPQRETLSVEHGGQVLSLALKEGKVVSGGSVQMFSAPPPAPANVSPAIVTSVTLNPTPADEQRRLEAVAAEVARRRALREQQAQQRGAQGPVGPVNASRQDVQQAQQMLQQQPGVRRQ